MTINVFIMLVTILSIVSSLLTEAIKKTIGTSIPTVVVIILAAITGWGGGFAAYTLLGIPFTKETITTLVLLAPTIWVGATVGYDKVLEAVEQIKGIIKK